MLLIMLHLQLWVISCFWHWLRFIAWCESYVSYTCCDLDMQHCIQILQYWALLIKKTASEHLGLRDGSTTGLTTGILEDSGVIDKLSSQYLKCYSAMITNLCNVFTYFHKYWRFCHKSGTLMCIYIHIPSWVPDSTLPASIWTKAYLLMLNFLEMALTAGTVSHLKNI